MNNINLIGRLGKDPELKQSTSGKSITNFSLAVQRKFKNNNGEYDTDWINCVAFGTTADFLDQHAGKGKRIGLSGELRQESWEDQTGEKKQTWKVIANTIDILDWDNQQNNNNYNNNNNNYNNNNYNNQNANSGGPGNFMDQGFNANNYNRVDNELPF